MKFYYADLVEDGLVRYLVSHEVPTLTEMQRKKDEQELFWQQDMQRAINWYYRT